MLPLFGHTQKPRQKITNITPKLGKSVWKFLEDMAIEQNERN